MSELAATRPLSSSPKQRHSNFLMRLGPGLITGAADDDPSGIATYSQVGSQFGLGMLWTMLFSFPLMAAIQEICARLGRISGVGIAANLRNHYPKPILYGIVLLLCAANIFNLGADISAMGAAAQLVFCGSVKVYALLFGIFSLLLQIFLPYRKYVRYLKWLTLVLFAYVAAAFTIHVPWGTALRCTVVPHLLWNVDYWMGMVAVLGTTISPYLFFWQTSEEVEEMRIHCGQSPLRRKPYQAYMQFRRIALDTRIGMGLSNLIAFFVILTAAVTIHNSASAAGIKTAADAAKALEPLAGRFAFLLFALGIVGTGLLAIPVLAGSCAYAVSETFRWRASLESKPEHARKFYMVIGAATILGLCLDFLGLDPIRALYWSAVMNGVVAVPLMIVLMIMSENPKVVGQFFLAPYLRVMGWVATGIMFFASLGFALSAFY